MKEKQFLKRILLPPRGKLETLPPKLNLGLLWPYGLQAILDVPVTQENLNFECAETFKALF